MAKQEEDNIGKKLDLADSWLTKFGIILKKHWGKLLFLLFCYCVYWAFTQPLPPEESSQKNSAELYSDSVYYESDSL